MKTLILKTQTSVYEIIKNEDNTLTVHQEPGVLYKDAGMLINNLGGIDAVIERCTPIDTTYEEYMDQRQKAIARSLVKKAEKINQLLHRAGAEDVSSKELFDIFIKLFEFDKVNRAALIDVFFLGKNTLNTDLRKKLGGFTVKPSKKGFISITPTNRFHNGPKKYSSVTAIKALL